jgi:heat shock protein 4
MNAVAGAIGIDMGSSTSVIAVAKKGGVEIMTNEGSHRETQNVVGFGENERFIGEQGHVQLKSNFKNTIVYPNRFLGLKNNCSFLEQETKHLYNKLATTADNKVAFEVQYKGEKKQFYPEQIVGMMLQKFKGIIRRGGIQHNDVVMSVPNYYTDVERKAVLDAAKVAEVNVVKLFNESTAIALAYGIFRRTEFDNTPRNVAFVDFGHSHLSVFTAAFTKDKLNIVNQIHDRHLGAREMDWTVLEYYSDMFNKQNGLNPKKSDKARLRLLESIEKQRKVLSANQEAGINIEYLMEDCDLNHTLTREQFEQIIAPVAERVKQTLLKIIDKNIPLHSVEMVGGATRIPIIQKIIQEVFNIEAVSKTMNGSEAIARGCAIQAAMLSPLFKVAQYGVDDANYFPVRCIWTFAEDNSPNKMEVEETKTNNPQKQTSILFDQGCPIPNVKSITFHRDESVDFKLLYDPPVEGFDTLIANFFIHNIKAKEQEHSLKLRVHLNTHGIVEFESAQLLEDYFEEVIAPPEPAPTQPNATPADPAKPQEPSKDKEQEVKKKKKSRQTNLKTDIVPISGYTQQAIAKFYEEEAQMANQDRVIHETYDKKNELESYIYDLRTKLNEKYKDYVKTNTKETFLGNLQTCETWLYQDGAKATKSAYASKLEELKKTGDPIVKRYNEHTGLPEAMANFVNTLNGYEAMLYSKEENFAHITPEERKPILELVQKHKTNIATQANDSKSWAKDEEPKFTIAAVNTEHEKFINTAKPVVNKPKPAPPKEEKKPEPTAEPPKAEQPKPEAPKDGEKMEVE